MERMERLIRRFEPATSPARSQLVEQFSGTYTAHGGSECLLRLWLSAQGFVQGAFVAEEETLEVRGGLSQTGAIHGFLLEPFGHLPVAMFSACPSPEGLLLEFGVPEFEQLLEGFETERVCFSRVQPIDS